MKRSSIFIVFVLSFALMVTGCGDDGPTAPVQTARPDVGQTEDIQEETCSSPQVECDGLCVDTDNSREHCGACANACDDSEVCALGSCALTCPGDLVKCDDQCINPNNDRSYCGAAGDCQGANAGNACGAGEVCASGSCSVSCAAGQIECGGICVNPQTDRVYCGAVDDCQNANAGLTCGAGQVCANGDCAVSCPPGLLECNGTCVNPQTSRSFCGATDDCQGANAGLICGAGQVCANGECGVSCPPGQLECDGTCVDPQTDRTYCGATNDCQQESAGDSCTNGEVCAGGTCAVSCPAGQLECGGTCVDPQTDRSYCGATEDCQGEYLGEVCGAGQVCASGACAFSCPAGQLECNGTCVNPQTDRSYCGATDDCQGENLGEVCGAGQVCASGACSVSCPPGQLECNGTCVDPQTDRTYCGATNDCQDANAGETCGAGQVCASGACAFSCPAGQLECNGTCVDPQTDRAYCGASNTCQGNDAGESCGAGQVCASGACAFSCPSGQLECNGTCVDPQTDRTYCGASNTCQGGDAGETCGPGQVCTSGSCTFSCPSGQIECGGTCVEPETDRNYCGAAGDCQGPNAGETCSNGEICSGGACQISCQQGLELCDGFCTNTAFDPSHCGGCGVTCSAGRPCVSGVCDELGDFPSSVLLTDSHKQQINSWVGNQYQDWELCYRRSTHGASSATFHDRCDWRGPTVTVAQLTTGRLIGGYASYSWRNTGMYFGNTESFLFSLTNNHRHSSPGASTGANWMYGHSSHGTTFGGGHDWYVASNMTTGYCNIGHTYQCRIGTYGSTTCRDDLCGNYSSWSISEMEVWVRAQQGHFPGSILMSEAQQDQINTWIGNPSQNWRLCYRRSTHGTNVSTFHGNCDGQGPSVTVAQLNTGRLIGGYASQSLRSVTGYYGDNSSFIFSLTNNHKHTPPGINDGSWLYSRSDYGPTFGGGHDWYIASNMTTGYCNIGNSYPCRIGSYGSATCRDDLCGNYSSWSIDDMEVWVHD